MFIENILMLIAGLSTSLIAGLMFGYSLLVNLRLGHTNYLEYLKAMQNINKTILNPVFLLTFVGPLIFLFLSTPLFVNQSDTDKTIYLGFAFVFYTVHFVITRAKNVPLNNRLEKLELNKLSNEVYAEIRSWYQKPWNRWHSIRNISSIISVVFFYIDILSI